VTDRLLVPLLSALSVTSCDALRPELDKNVELAVQSVLQTELLEVESTNY